MMYNLASDQRSSGRGTVEARRRQRRRMQPTLLALEDRRLLSTFVGQQPHRHARHGPDRPAPGDRPGECRHGGAETITFDSTVFKTPQTITLTQGQLELSDTTGTETITRPGRGRDGQRRRERAGCSRSTRASRRRSRD